MIDTPYESIELRHFRYFVAVAETLHFGRAAERLHMSQPPLSMQIRQLEAMVGAALFERTQRRVALTAAGEAFLSEARRTLTAAREALEAARQSAAGQQGRLRIGFVSSAPFNVLPRILRAYRERYPRVTVDLVERGSADQLRALVEGEQDVGLVRLPAATTGVSLQVLLREPLVVALPDTHRLAARRSLEARALAAEPFVMFPRRLGPGLYELIMRFCAAAGFVPHIGQEVEQMHAIVGLVGSGMGVALVPRSMHLISGSGVVFKPLRRSPHVDMALARRTHDSSPHVETFCAVARKVSP
jgi:DNA-binding transcriptional LysR family regulator